MEIKIYFSVCKSKQMKKYLYLQVAPNFSSYITGPESHRQNVVWGRDRQCVDQENPGEEYKGIMNTSWALSRPMNGDGSLWKPALCVTQFCPLWAHLHGSVPGTMWCTCLTCSHLELK